MAGAFPITNPTIGGGTAFNDLLAQFLGTLGDQRLGRADVGAGLFGGLLEAETAARRRPVNIVDQLMLAQEFGSVLPLSQISGKRLSQLGGTTSPDLQNLFQSLMGFSQQANPQGQVINVIQRPGQPDRAVVRFPDGRTEIVPVPAGGGLQTVQGRTGPFGVSSPDVQNFLQDRVRRLSQGLQGRSPQERQQIIEFLRIHGEREARGQEQQAREQRTQGFAHGGRLTIDPAQRRSTRGVVAGPASIVDRTGRTAGVIGEAGQRENVLISPQGAPPPSITPPPPPRDFPVGVPIDLPTAPPAPGDPGLTVPEQLAGFTGQPRDVRFRMEALMNAAPGLTPDMALQISQRPGAFERFLGVESDPRAVAARLLGGATTSDVRFRDPLVRSLALGRAPTSAEINMEELSDLPPDLQQALIGLIGQEQFPGFLFALQQGTPRGAQVRGRAASGLAV